MYRVNHSGWQFESADEAADASVKEHIAGGVNTPEREQFVNAYKKAPITPREAGAFSQPGQTALPGADPNKFAMKQQTGEAFQKAKESDVGFHEGFTHRVQRHITEPLHALKNYLTKQSLPIHGIGTPMPNRAQARSLRLKRDIMSWDPKLYHDLMEQEHKTSMGRMKSSMADVAAASSASGSGGATTMSNLNTRDEFPRRSFGDETDIMAPYDIDQKSVYEWARDAGGDVYRAEGSNYLIAMKDNAVFDPVLGFNGNVHINDYLKSVPYKRFIKVE